jgi:predicted RecB family nuclease
MFMWVIKVVMEMLTTETCEQFAMDEDSCATCECWNHCYGESLWVEAIREYDRSR